MRWTESNIQNAISHKVLIWVVQSREGAVKHDGKNSPLTLEYERSATKILQNSSRTYQKTIISTSSQKRMWFATFTLWFSWTTSLTTTTNQYVNRHLDLCPCGWPSAKNTDKIHCRTGKRTLRNYESLKPNLRLFQCDKLTRHTWPQILIASNLPIACTTDLVIYR